VLGALVVMIAGEWGESGGLEEGKRRRGPKMKPPKDENWREPEARKDNRCLRTVVLLIIASNENNPKMRTML